MAYALTSNTLHNTVDGDCVTFVLLGTLGSASAGALLSVISTLFSGCTGLRFSTTTAYAPQPSYAFYFVLNKSGESLGMSLDACICGTATGLSQCDLDLGFTVKSR